MKIEKKIAFVTPIYFPAKLSGSSIIIKEIAECLVKSDYDVSVITSNALTGRYWYDPIFGRKVNKNFEIINNVKIYRLFSNQIISSVCFILVRYLNFLIPQKIINKLQIVYNGPYLNGLDDILIKEKFDVIHCSPFPLNINRQVVNAIGKLKKKPKLILTPLFHTELKEFKNLELNKMLSQANTIHVVTNSEKFFLRKTFNTKDSKIVYIPLFLNLKKLISLRKLEKQVNLFKKKYKLYNKKIVFFAGNKGYNKGVIALLRAMEELHREDPSYFFITVGNSMPEWTKEKNKINPKFLLDFDYVNEKTKETIFSVCDVYCMPAISESFGLTYLEAWHKKKPVIAARMPVSEELVESINAGMLVNFNDINDLKEKIKEIFKNRNKSRNMGESGFLALNKKYNINSFIRKFKKII